MTKGIEWTSEMIFELQRLQSLEDNLSFNVIAKRMSETFGVHFTRNSTVGKSHRLKLPPRPIREHITSENTHPRKDDRVIKLRPPLPPRPPTRKRKTCNVNLINLRNGDCKWPAGEGPYLFCGKPAVEDGAPYCAMHAEMAYVKPKKTFA
jgi:hypothetical protein